MSVDLQNAFRLSFVTGETKPPIPAVSEILGRLLSGPVWDGASIAPANDHFLVFTPSGTKAMDSSVRIQQPGTTSNINWRRRRVGNVRRGSVVALDGLGHFLRRTTR